MAGITWLVGGYILHISYTWGMVCGFFLPPPHSHTALSGGNKFGCICILFGMCLVVKLFEKSAVIFVI